MRIRTHEESIILTSDLQMNTGRIGKGYLSTEAAARQGGGLAPMLTLATLRPRYMLIGKCVCVCVCVYYR